jgi:hypothetical protein
MSKNLVVARFKDGSLLKGQTSDFFPNKAVFHLELTDGKIMEINAEQLKSLFFVKDLTGNKDRVDTYDETIPGGGKKIEILFTDGEKLVGYSQGYSPARQGFFILPANRNGNNERIYIVRSATEKVTFL